MYPLPVGLALVDLLVEHSENRLENASRAAREDKNVLHESARRTVPHRRARLASILGLRGRAVAG